MGSLTVVGLGPGPSAWLTQAGSAALRAEGVRVLARTRLHPALEGVPYESFDELYAAADELDGLFSLIADRLGEAAATADVVYAVPGDGVLAEGVVAALRERDLRATVLPGVSDGLAALAASGFTAVDGAQSVDALSVGGSSVLHRVELNPRWVAAVTGVFSRVVAGDLKLALQRVYPEAHPAVVVHHPGLSDERVVETSVARLDRERVDWDHLTHVVLPGTSTDQPTGSAHGLRAIVARLRAPEIGCPWDLEQTRESLIPFVLEEAYEVVDAIRDGSAGDLAEELGDLLLQVALHAEVADQTGDFDWNDVVRAISAKLIRRHPHVFGEVQVAGSQDVVRNWDALKAAEKEGEPGTSALAGVPRSLPALKQAAEMGRKAATAGFDWTDRAGALAKVREELAELLRAESVAERGKEYGDLLWMLANLAMRDGLDPEEAVRRASEKFRRRFEAVERRALARGWDSLRGRTEAELQMLWQEAKAATAGTPREADSAVPGDSMASALPPEGRDSYTSG